MPPKCSISIQPALSGVRVRTTLRSKREREVHRALNGPDGNRPDDTAVQGGILYRNERRISPNPLGLKLLIANMATAKIGIVTIRLSEVSPTERF